MRQREQHCFLDVHPHVEPQPQASPGCRSHLLLLAGCCGAISCATAKVFAALSDISQRPLSSLEEDHT